MKPENFDKEWELATQLFCPKLRFLNGSWLYDEADDPCIKGDCNLIGCHNYKKPFEEPERLIKKEVSGKPKEVCKIGQLHHEIAIDLQVAKDMKSLGEPYSIDGFIKVLEHYKEMVSGEKKVEET